MFCDACILIERREPDFSGRTAFLNKIKHEYSAFLAFIHLIRVSRERRP